MCEMPVDVFGSETDSEYFMSNTFDSRMWELYLHRLKILKWQSTQTCQTHCVFYVPFSLGQKKYQ